MIDLSIIILILIFAILGYKKGLIQEIMTLVGSILALVLSFILYPTIQAILKGTVFYTTIYTGILDKIEMIDLGKGLQSQASAIMENITWFPETLLSKVVSNNNTAMYEYLGVRTVQEYVSTYITNMIISLIAILITWLLLKVVFVAALKFIGSIIEYLPIISTFNQLGGLIIGILKGVLTVSIIMLVVPLILSNPDLGEISMSIESSFLTQWFYNHNLIIWLYDYFLV